jgi:hypothetical protein
MLAKLKFFIYQSLGIKTQEYIPMSESVPTSTVTVSAPVASNVAQEVATDATIALTDAAQALPVIPGVIADAEEVASGGATVVQRIEALEQGLATALGFLAQHFPTNFKL